MQRILFLVGSLRAQSINRRLCLVVERMLPKDDEATRYDLSEIPLYHGDHDRDESPTSVRGLRDAMSSADGVVWTMPEHSSGCLAS